MLGKCTALPTYTRMGLNYLIILKRVAAPKLTRPRPETKHPKACRRALTYSHEVPIDVKRVAAFKTTHPRLVPQWARW